MPSRIGVMQSNQEVEMKVAKTIDFYLDYHRLNL